MYSLSLFEEKEGGRRESMVETERNVKRTKKRERERLATQETQFHLEGWPVEQQPRLLPFSGEETERRRARLSRHVGGSRDAYKGALLRAPCIFPGLRWNASRSMAVRLKETARLSTFRQSEALPFRSFLFIATTKASNRRDAFRDDTGQEEEEEENPVPIVQRRVNKRRSPFSNREGG